MAGTKYNIRLSIEGSNLGLDTTQGPVQAANLPALALGDYAPFLMGREFMGLRLFPAGLTGQAGNDYIVRHPALHCELFDDFLGVEISPVLFNALAGTGGSPVAPAISPPATSSAANGVLLFTSGSDATATMATNGSQLTGALSGLVSNGGTVFEARIGGLSAATAQSICFGLVDVVTLSAPFTNTTGTTFVKTATNGACFLQDSRGTNKALTAISTNAAAAVQTTTLANAVNITAATFNTYRIEIDAAGNAVFFIDGVQVASQLLAVATTAVLAPSIGMFASSGTAETMLVDYVMYKQARV